MLRTATARVASALDQGLRQRCERPHPQAAGELEAAVQQRLTFTVVVGRPLLDQDGAEAATRLCDKRL